MSADEGRVDVAVVLDGVRRVVAQEQVEIRYLQDEIARLERVQTEDGARIQASSAALKSGTVQLVVAGRPYSRSGLENDVRLALRKHQTNHGLLESKRRLLDARQRSLAAAQQKLTAVCGEKENLVIAVEQLRARLRETQALEASSCRIDLDDTKLAEAKETIARVRKRLDVAQQLIENDSGGILEIPETDPQVDVTSEVDRYFGATPDKSGLTAKSH